jgi:hypothetical protein
MAQIVIRNIADAVVDAVRCLDEVRRRIGRLPGPSVVEDLRRDRDRDNI